jgi:hypothetical protein
MLSARLDYGLWYGDNEAVCLNVLVVEAKKTDLEGGVAQALGYMGEYLTMPNILYIRKLTCFEGCIHRQRKKLTKRDCTVYGMASNGVGFSFLKISHDSKVSFFYDFLFESFKPRILTYTSGQGTWSVSTHRNSSCLSGSSFICFARRLSCHLPIPRRVPPSLIHRRDRTELTRSSPPLMRISRWSNRFCWCLWTLEIILLSLRSRFTCLRTFLSFFAIP